MQGTTIKFTGFIGLSLMVHGLLLFHQTPSQIQPDPRPIGSRVLSISLANQNQGNGHKIQSITGQKSGTAQKTEKASQARIAKIETTTPSTTGRQRRDNRFHQGETIMGMSGKILPARTLMTATSHVTTQLTQSETGQMSATSLRETVREADQRNFLLGEIHHQLSRHMSYPASARKRGWEGSVMIGFNIDRQGYLHNVHLKRTSGYSLLDNAALIAIKKVNHIPVYKWGNVFQPIALQVPVIYRLTSS